MFRIAADDLVAGFAKDIDVFRAYQLADFHVRAVHGAQRYRAIEHEFHVARTAGLFGSQGNLLGDVARGD